MATTPATRPVGARTEDARTEDARTEDAHADSRRSIVLVSTALQHGGAEHQVVLLARGLARRGWRVRVVSMRPPEAHQEALAEAGVPVTSLDMARRLPDPRALVRLVRLLRRWRPDVLHGHMVHANLLTRAARPFARTPVVVSTAHNIVEGPRWREVAYRLTEPLCDVTTNVTPAAVERYIRVGAASAEKIRYLPNGIDTARFRPHPEHRAALRRQLLLEDRVALLAVGRLEAAKDHETMLAGLRLVVERRPDAVLLVVGRGSRARALQGQARALGLDRHVRFLGAREDVPALMSAADVYVMSSAWEGLPLVLLEAASAALPIVATDVGGNAEVVLPRVNGLLAPPRNPDALAAALLQVLEMPPEERRAWGATGQALVRDEYDIEAVLDQWEALYEEFLARTGRRPRPPSEGGHQARRTVRRA